MNCASGRLANACHLLHHQQKIESKSNKEKTKLKNRSKQANVIKAIQADAMPSGGSITAVTHRLRRLSYRKAVTDEIRAQKRYNGGIRK
jgi:hypothetical protein